MYAATFIFAKGDWDDAFHALDATIAAAARALPGYRGEESWDNAATGTFSNTYYWDSLEALQALMEHPAHREAKRQQARWLQGYQVIVSKVLRSHGDGRLPGPPHPAQGADAAAGVGFSHVNLQAPRPQLDALRDFYRDVVGLEPGPRPAFRRFGYWLYAGGQDVLHLTESEGPAADAASPASIDHLAFRGQDAAATRARLHALGLPFRETAVPGSGVVQFFLRDPMGHGVELNFSPGA